jgi:hypothetical protein
VHRNNRRSNRSNVVKKEALRSDSSKLKRKKSEKQQINHLKRTELREKNPRGTAIISYQIQWSIKPAS